MSEALDWGLYILCWLLVGLGVLVLSCIWAVIIFASILVSVRFYNSYRTASVELEKEEAPEDDGPPLRF